MNTVRKLFRRKKQQQKREVLVEIERFKNQNVTRKLYRNVNETSNGYSQQPLLCKDKSELVLADEERCIIRWAEYFRELLNPDNPTDRNDQDNDLPFQTAKPFTAEPTLQEVKNEILRLKNFKALGIDKLPGELFKHGGNALWIELTRFARQIFVILSALRILKIRNACGKSNFPALAHDIFV